MQKSLRLCTYGQLGLCRGRNGKMCTCGLDHGLIGRMMLTQWPAGQEQNTKQQKSRPVLYKLQNRKILCKWEWHNENKKTWLNLPTSRPQWHPSSSFKPNGKGLRESLSMQYCHNPWRYLMVVSQLVDKRHNTIRRSTNRLHMRAMTCRIEQSYLVCAWHVYSC